MNVEQLQEVLPLLVPILIIQIALVVYALVQIFGSSADTGSKILWTLLVGLFPLFGLIIWFLAGPGTPKK